MKNWKAWILPVVAIVVVGFIIMNASGPKNERMEELKIPEGFRGPTTTPHVKGPSGPPPGQ
jgi:cytochrome c-type biogenesis protein CcmH/NrfF